MGVSGSSWAECMPVSGAVFLRSEWCRHVAALRGCEGRSSWLGLACRSRSVASHFECLDKSKLWQRSSGASG